MALDQLLTMLAQNAGASGDNYVEGQNNALRAQALRLQLGQAQAAQQQQQAYQQWAQSYLTDPTPQKLMEGATLFPDQAEGLSKGWKLKDDAVKQADQTFYGQVYAAAKSGKNNILVQQLKNRRQAEAARGIDVTELDDVINDVEANEPDALKSVQGYALAHIYAGDPGNFAKAFGIGDKAEAPKVLGYGDALVNPDGSVVYQAPDAPFTLSEGQARYANPQSMGGDPGLGTGGASAPSGRYAGGWTPRARNGGDNNDAAVDSKIGGMSQFLGFSPDEPFPPGLSNMQIAKALTLSEGGAGSLADRNNNPGNLIDPKTGGFRKFPTKEAGLAAAAGQVARNRSRGQNTIRSMVEGRPVGGGPSAVASRPKDAEPTAARMTPQEVAAEGLDPNTVYYRNKDGVPQAVSGQNTKTRPLRPLPDGLSKRIEGEVDQLVSLTNAANSFQDDFGGHTVAGDLSNTAQSLFGTGTPGQRDWWANFRTTDNVIRNGLFGASLTAGEKEAYNATTVTPRMSPSEIKKNLNRRVKIIQSALERRKKAVIANKYDPEAVDALFDTGLGGQAPSAPSGFKILRVRPK